METLALDTGKYIMLIVHMARFFAPLDRVDKYGQNHNLYYTESNCVFQARSRCNAIFVLFHVDKLNIINYKKIKNSY